MQDDLAIFYRDQLPFGELLPWVARQRYARYQS